MTMSVQNTAKMNLDQVKSRQNATRENSEGIYAERKKLEETGYHEIISEESIKMELETSQQLENELTRQMESSQKWLEKRVRQKRQKCAKMNILPQFCCIGAEKRFYRGEFCPYSGKRWENSGRACHFKCKQRREYGEIERKGSTDYRNPADDREFKGII